MNDVPKNLQSLPAGTTATSVMPAVVDRATFEEDVASLRIREKAHTREGDAIAAAHRRLPMVDLDPTVPVVGPDVRVSCWTSSRADNTSSSTASYGTPAIPLPNL